ncbi:MAG: PAS domain-containing sensor histidine kinase [Candidatus Hodarchaeales archaeon]|jgi:PAS domain S-box-containing protein
MIDLDDFLKALRIRTENLEDQYQMMINQIYSKFRIPYDINKNLYEESYPFFSKIIVDFINSNYINQKLGESEEKYRLITENANDMITVQNDKFEYEYINEPVFIKILGYSNYDLIGKTNLHLIHPDELKGTTLASSRILRKGKGIHRVRFRAKNGDYKWLEVTAKNFFNSNGEKRVLSILRDVTEHIKVELKLKESEEKFRTITDQSFMGIAILQDNVFKYVNQQVANISGYSKEEILNFKQGEFLNLVHPDDRAFVSEQARKKQYGLKGTINNYQLKALRKTGEIIWIEIFSKTINYGGTSADLITIMDITEKKEFEELILEENRKLAELDEIRSNFITRASHELKTPLVSICGSTEFLLDHYQDKYSDEIKSIIEIIKSGGKRLKDLIKKLIDVSRLEVNELKLEKQKENLKNILNSCINNLEYMRRGRGISLSVNTLEDFYLELDSIRIEQAIMNILINAIKNTPPNGNISIKLKPSHFYVDIVVKDAGVGLTKVEQTMIFKKFGKIERFGKGLDVDTEGSGLGLYISKEIVELHGGQILVKSEGRNKGSTFIIRLPLN